MNFSDMHQGQFTGLLQGTVYLQSEYPRFYYVVPIVVTSHFGQPSSLDLEVPKVESPRQPPNTAADSHHPVKKEEGKAKAATNRKTRKRIQKQLMEKHRLRRLKRNVITNIGNQLLTFLCMRRRSQMILSRIAPELKEEDQLAQYYSFTRMLKKSMHSYVSFGKLEDIWRTDFEGNEEMIFREVIRRLSSYYLREILPLAVMTSKKMNAQYRTQYLQLRRDLLTRLKSR